MDEELAGKGNAATFKCYESICEGVRNQLTRVRTQSGKGQLGWVSLGVQLRSGSGWRCE